VSASPDTDSPTPLQGLGAALRDARQARGLDRAALAAQLHMGAEQLQALEEGDSSRLPEPVFVIAQARRVALALGVEIDERIAPLKQASLGLKPAPAPLGANTAAPRGSGRRPWLGAAGAAAVLLVGGAGLWGWSQFGRRPLNRPQPASAAVGPLAPAAARPSSAAAGSLLLSSREPSWLTVQSASGQTLFEGLFRGRRSFPVGQGLQVRAGRPDLVQASLGSAAAKPLGRIDQITWVRFGPAAPAPAP
jgi:cytoskeleton protein RodZ